MRIVAGAALFLLLQACSTTNATNETFEQPNSIMAVEIDRRVAQLPYQHRGELYNNLVWLVQAGEQSIPAMLTGLTNNDPKVRSSCAWVLGRLRDRRTIPALQTAINDSEQVVRLEVARTLVAMGDLQWSQTLIEGLDSDEKQVRCMCHETLKTATGHDFGYDHLNANETERRVAVLRWRQWWGEYSGDTFFATNYQNTYNLPNVAAPAGETRTNGDPTNNGTSTGGTSTGGTNDG
ncbi:MAG: HEAT repeat domain-containing protein [Planctomycetes bacterium]|nr:HEAT repeat domain-containing protein [Planctomycetota bacterium]